MGEDSPPKFCSGTPCFIVCVCVFWGPPLNLRGKSSPRKFGGYGLTGLVCLEGPKEQRRLSGLTLSHLWVFEIHRLKFIQCRTGAWQRHRSFSPDPSPQCWIKSLDPRVHVFIQYWAGVWQPYKKSTTPPSTTTRSKSVSQKGPSFFLSSLFSSWTKWDWRQPIRLSALKL